MGIPRPLFAYFRSFQTQILWEKLKASTGFELGSSEWALEFDHDLITQFDNCLHKIIIIKSFKQKNMYIFLALKHCF